MDLSGISSTTIQPGPIGLTDFAFSNIILAVPTQSVRQTGISISAASSGSDYKLPNGGALLQTFSVPDPNGKSITKVGDVWAKRYISQRTSDVNVIPSDASGSGSLVVKSNSGAPIVTMCYLMWLTVTQPGDWSTLTGTYLIFGDSLTAPLGSSSPLKTSNLTSDMKEDWLSI